MFKYFLAGLGTKIATGFDDTLTHIPIISYLTKTWREKFAFSVGIFVAVCLALAFALVFSYLIPSIPYYRYILSGIIFTLSILIYLEVFQKKRDKKANSKIRKVRYCTGRRYFKLLLFGFIAATATVIDDTLAYSSILVHAQKSSAVFGILFATVLEISLVIKFSKKLSHFKYKKHLASGGLLILSILIFFGVV